MQENVLIEELHSIEKDISHLSSLLVKVVEDGASIGFLPPMELTEADAYWNSVLRPEVILFVTKMNGEIVGSVQLHLSMKPNGMHRAEIAKLMTDPDFRRKGIAGLLLQAAEKRAKRLGRTLLVLDTREGDVSNNLYVTRGYAAAGRIPYYARSADGELHSTIFYYKPI